MRNSANVRVPSQIDLDADVPSLLGIVDDKRGLKYTFGFSDGFAVTVIIANVDNRAMFNAMSAAITARRTNGGN